MYMDAWNVDPLDADYQMAVGSPLRSLSPGESLFATRECDLSDLPADAADAVSAAGAILQAYIENAIRQPRA
jgi:hypothetical protein